MAAAQAGVVMPAGNFGKVKTALQVAMVLSLIAVSRPQPVWLTALVYVTVAVTVLSGADYAFGLRNRLEASKRAGAARRAAGTGDV
jgi:CDP-diacylglycerol--glycerol-3-phosphate 3-phosphatidyltransferase